MKTKRIEMKPVECMDSEELSITDEWQVSQEMQSWFLPMYAAACELATDEWQDRMQEIIVVIDLLLALS